MKWFDKWFSRKVQKSWELARQEKESNSIGVANPRRFQQSAMQFSVYNACGGWVIEYNHYDERQDKHTTRMHVIPVDQDLNESIANIINYENMMK